MSGEPLRAVRTETGDRFLAHNARADGSVMEWLANDIRAIEQEEFDKTVVALMARVEHHINHALGLTADDRAALLVSIAGDLPLGGTS